MLEAKYKVANSFLEPSLHFLAADQILLNSAAPFDLTDPCTSNCTLQYTVVHYTKLHRSTVDRTRPHYSHAPGHEL